MAIALPFVAVAVVIATGGSAPPFFPPFICVAKDVDVLFYTFVPPGSLLLGIGVSLIITIFSILIRRTKTPRQKECTKEKVTNLYILLLSYTAVSNDYILTNAIFIFRVGILRQSI